MADYVIPERPPKPECAFCREEGYPGVYHDVLPDYRHYTPAVGTAQELVWNDTEHQDIGLYGGYASGKLLALDTLVPTPTGWTTMGEIKVGDQVFDEDGNARNVLQVTPILFGRTCYEIEFSNGETVVADAEHPWPARDRPRRDVHKEGKGKENSKRSYRRHRWPRPKATQELYEKMQVLSRYKNGGGHRLRIDLASPLQRRSWDGHFIKSIRPVPSVPVRCIQVDSPSHLYLVGRSMIPTHNSTLVAALTMRNLMELPGWKVLWLVPDFSVHYDTTLPKIVELLPSHMRPASVSALRKSNTKHISLYWNPDAGRASFSIPEIDSEIILRSFNQSQVGFDVHQTIMDEVEADPHIQVKLIEDTRWRTRRPLPGLSQERSFALNSVYYTSTPNTGFIQDYFTTLPNSVLYSMCAIENPYNNEYKIRQELERAKSDPMAFSMVTGVFIPRQGNVLTNFKKSTNVIRHKEMPNQAEFEGFSGGIDWAYAGSSVVAPVGILRDNGVDRYYVLDEFYERGAEWPSSINNALIRFSNRFPALSRYWMDPHGRKREPSDEYSMLHMDLRERGWEVDGKTTDLWLSSSDQDDAMRYRASRLMELLEPDATGKPRLLLNETCINIIRDFERWKWMESKGSGFNSETWKVSKHYKDGIDAVFYAIQGWERKMGGLRPASRKRGYRKVSFSRRVTDRR